LPLSCPEPPTPRKGRSGQGNGRQQESKTVRTGYRRQSGDTRPCAVSSGTRQQERRREPEVSSGIPNEPWQGPYQTGSRDAGERAGALPRSSPCRSSGSGASVSILGGMDLRDGVVPEKRRGALLRCPLAVRIGVDFLGRSSTTAQSCIRAGIGWWRTSGLRKSGKTHRIVQGWAGAPAGEGVF
jgi:hypothetical protein